MYGYVYKTTNLINGKIYIGQHRSEIFDNNYLGSGKLIRRAFKMWELWQVIKNTPFNIIDYTNYTVINDYTCDIDNPEDVKRWQNT